MCEVASRFLAKSFSWHLRFDPAACEPFVRLLDTDVCWHLTAVELRVASVLPGLFL